MGRYVEAVIMRYDNRLGTYGGKPVPRSKGYPRISSQIGTHTFLKLKYTLRVALASATVAELQVRVNDPKANPPLFSSGVIGKDNSIARYGIHGLYWLFNADVPGAQLVEGKNTMRVGSPMKTFMEAAMAYDSRGNPRLDVRRRGA
ncbi:hypothetical protein IFM89_001431 [Coptis chinensis]|uniref:Rhamnogalacturonan lyase domain-containing protein n=1 Tax=Coptis chinensis TaxID=261450 RepID=A0A835H3P5_9MAGN|nr:hypothetical protein IFM89_001431 [Coptis chinensis]